MSSPLFRYELACAHEHSCCTLLAKTDYKIEGKWHTWIDYDRYSQLIKQYVEVLRSALDPTVIESVLMVLRVWVMMGREYVNATNGEWWTTSNIGEIEGGGKMRSTAHIHNSTDFSHS